ncbi:MAG: hypothetical protein WCF94_02955 [bacterium]
MKEILAKTSLTIGIIAYSLMIFSTLMGTGENLSFTTFALWSMLNLITAYTTYKKKANPSIPLVYGSGATLTAIVLLFKGRCQWSTLDSVVAALVITCLLLWKIKGDKWALISSTLAAAIAGIPFLVVIWKNPEISPVLPNALFTLTNLLSFFAADKWTVEDRLFSGINVIFCFLFVLPWLLC